MTRAREAATLADASAITLANRYVNMISACRMAGMDVPDDVRDRGSKVHCPFGTFSHPDGGRDKAFRLYFDHGYCFAESEYFSPVKLCAWMWDVTFEQAALEMLDRSGYRPLSYAQHWQDVVRAVPEPDRGALAQALSAYCARLDPGWAERQYDAAVSEYLARCLGLLPQVRTEADCSLWLGACKRAMQAVLRKAVSA